MEEDGISVARLETALEHEVPAFLNLVQDLQNPAGATLLFEKRQRVVELANRHGFWAIEDVPYRKLRYRGEDLPLLREIDPSCVITMSSFSKLLSPGIRVGFMVAPAGLIEAVTRLGEEHLPLSGLANPEHRRGVPQARLARAQHRTAQRAVPASLANNGRSGAPRAA